VRFDDAFLDELRSRLRPSDVIGRTVKLRRQGREFVGLSPFSKERTPSFFVNDDKGRFFDFSSGKNGDLISFLQETERLSFVEAVERLAAEAGMSLPAPDPRAAETERKLASLTDWLEMAAAWFEAELRRPAGREARAYLERRGLPEADWKRFRLGYAPGGRTALKDYLVAKGAQPASLIEAGLLISPEDGGAPYDRFRDRVMFPIESARGQIVSFGGRALDPQAKAKYLNGTDTPLFHKGRLLYGLPEARKLLHAGPSDDAPLVAVEGYMDVIACQRAGVAAVATMGTALTEDQMQALWRLHAEPTLCFDGDHAGRAAAFRAIDRALPLLTAGHSFKFALALGGKDPDEVLREAGAAALKTRLADTVAFVELLFVRERDAEPLDTPERRAALRQRLRKAANSIADADLRREYGEDLERRVAALFPATGRQHGRFPPPAIRVTEQGKQARKRLPETTELLAGSLVRYALSDPAVLDKYLDSQLLSEDGFGDSRVAPLMNEVVKLRVESSHLDEVDFVGHLRSGGFGSLLEQIDRAAELMRAPFNRGDLSQANARSEWSRAFSLLSELVALEHAFEAAKGRLDEQVGKPATEFTELKIRRDKLSRAITLGTIFEDDG
jgi:DNA primase